jgi:hypothetical protein
VEDLEDLVDLVDLVDLADRQEWDLYIQYPGRRQYLARREEQTKALKWLFRFPLTVVPIKFEDSSPHACFT